MRTTTLTWQQAWWLCAILGSAVIMVRLIAGGPVRAPRLRILIAAATEIALLAGLDGLWILAGRPTAADPRGGFDRARWLMRMQHDLHLPHEQTLVNALAPHALLARFANIYYASMHFTVMGILLVWLFWRHRERYRAVRTWVVLFTALALVVQLVPVAPPRLMPELGFVDVAKLYGQSVYGGIGNFQPAQFGAMPSVHVGWALVTGWVVCTISTSPWRWIAAAHAALMSVLVVATANHWWADGIVAAGLLLLARVIQLGTRALIAMVQARAGASRAVAQAPESPAGVIAARLDRSSAPT